MATSSTHHFQRPSDITITNIKPAANSLQITTEGPHLYRKFFKASKIEKKD